MAEIDKMESIDLPDIVPLLTVRDLVVYPYMIVPLFVSREMSVAAIDDALSADRLVLLAAPGSSPPVSDSKVVFLPIMYR